jgi:hypothetical protein
MLFALSLKYLDILPKGQGGEVEKHG